MAVHAKIFPNGLVRVAGSGEDVERLLASHYLRRDGRLWKTWWTYATDLRRDFPHVVFREGSAAALQSLVRTIEEARRGDDARVRSLFDLATPPKPFQFEAIHFAVSQRYVVLADGVGLGKTIEAMGAMLATFASGQARRAVICVPASLKSQWFRELHDKANSRVLPAAVKIATGTPQQRRALYRSDWRVLIISHDVTRIDADVLEGVTRTIDFVILDEASVLKNGTGPTVAALHRVFRFARWRLALTATPIENGLLDLYHVFRWVDRKVFMSQLHFNDRYVLFRRQHFSVKKKGGPETGSAKMNQLVPYKYINLNEVKAKIRPAFVRRTAKEVGVQLPSVSFTREVIELAAPQRKVYDLVRDRVKLLCEANPELAGEALSSPIQALRQACDSTELVPEGASLARPSSSKVVRLKELLDGEFRGEQVLIFTDYERFVRILMRELRKHEPVSYTGPMSERERRLSIDMFTRGRRRIMIATKAAERGHNLQCAGLVVNVDLPWNPAALKQRLGRLRRLESKHDVIRVRDFAAEDTIETKLIAPKLEFKHRVAEDVLGEDELSRAPGPGVEYSDLSAKNLKDKI